MQYAPRMTSDLTTIRNVGPVMAARLEWAGIADAAELRRLGPDETYRRMLAAGDRPHLMAYQALVMGLQGRPFTDPDPDEKTHLRTRFEALRAEIDQPRGIEAVLDTLGVAARRG